MKYSELKFFAESSLIFTKSGRITKKSFGVMVILVWVIAAILLTIPNFFAGLLIIILGIFAFFFIFFFAFVLDLYIFKRTFNYVYQARKLSPILYETIGGRKGEKMESLNIDGSGVNAS